MIFKPNSHRLTYGGKSIHQYGCSMDIPKIPADSLNKHMPYICSRCVSDRLMVSCDDCVLFAFFIKHVEDYVNEVEERRG